jgi:hypothetical protein
MVSLPAQLFVLPEAAPRVVGGHLAQFPEQLLDALVVHVRRHQDNLHKLIAPLSRAAVRHALLAHAEPLSVLGARGNLERLETVDGGHLDLGGIPPVPADPLPCTRKRDPFRAPGGMRTSTVSGRATRPSPWQDGQALRSRPEPPQRGQVRLKRIAPAICDTCPEPSHCGQVAALPANAPVPPQAAQVSCRVMVRRF